MPFVQTPFVPATPIVDTAVRGELDGVRSWLNAGMVVTDIDAVGVPVTAVYRPETRGFPAQDVECNYQKATVAQHAQDDPSRGANLSFVSRLRLRTSIFLLALGEGEASRLPYMSQRVTIRGTSDVEVSASWRALSAYDPSLGGAPLHPEKAGIFIVCFQEVAAAVKTQMSGTLRRLNVQFSTAGAGIIAASTFNAGDEVLNLAPGTYDFWVEFRLDVGQADATQVIINAQSFVVEVHQQQ